MAHKPQAVVYIHLYWCIYSLALILNLYQCCEGVVWESPDISRQDHHRRRFATKVKRVSYCFVCSRTGIVLVIVHLHFTVTRTSAVTATRNMVTKIQYRKWYF